MLSIGMNQPSLRWKQWSDAGFVVGINTRSRIRAMMER
eukprot:SAG11_NODE_3136_length_2662_cov_3.598908_2_plen_37_part_01